ncbi:MAG: Nif3-like dinuclear metal center hexameric protein [Faecalimonas sp.]|nr:Nif3-like dinuclear metal center hexameric protein [Faecalimonas sp.]
MLCRDIMKVIEATYPKHAALEWDNVGLLVGRTEKDVKKIYVALDATDEVIERAVAADADMLITHHPLLFSPLKKITDEHFIGSRVVKLLQHDISYYAMHTNYDVCGMADISAAILGLDGAETLEVTDEESREGIGRVGKLACPMSLQSCGEFIKEKFQLDSVKVFGDLSSTVQRIAICPGSGKGMIEIALEKNADVLVTGDIGHHEGIDAVARGLAIIDAGHYGLEHIFIEDMANYLKKNVEGIVVETHEITHPFQVI